MFTLWPIAPQAQCTQQTLSAPSIGRVMARLRQADGVVWPRLPVGLPTYGCLILNSIWDCYIMIATQALQEINILYTWWLPSCRDAYRLVLPLLV